ncbi:MAG: Uma2 family endonuclease [Labilithrix sp.]|nr:Uma2 family endonuclease [Labilithrix sp.]MCW5815298.1 Uma2 family endonuclease [Labilithrix sp.]
MLDVSAKMTADEFLAWEREQPGRHHYVRGDVVEVAGGSPRHNRLSARATSALDRAAVGTACGAFSSDQKLGLHDDEFVCADGSVVCGPLQLRPGTKDVITNPSLVVEVLSKSTEGYDRGDKQRGYLALQSLVHLLFVSQREVRVEVYTRQDDGSFRFEVLGAGATIALQQPAATLSVDAIYAGVFDLPADDG